MLYEPLYSLFALFVAIPAALATCGHCIEDHEAQTISEKWLGAFATDGLPTLGDIVTNDVCASTHILLSPPHPLSVHPPYFLHLLHSSPPRSASHQSTDGRNLDPHLRRRRHQRLTRRIR